MPLVLPPDHPLVIDVPHDGPPATPPPAVSIAPGRVLRVGIINIMPRIEAYEPSLLGPLGRVPARIEPVFIRLRSHGYGSSDQGHLDRFYRTFDQVLADGPLDGLILTGAPVEEIPFEQVRYWQELGEILGFARQQIPGTLGICWGGLALGGLVGVKKTLFSRKLFGVFENRVLVPDHPVLQAPGGSFVCAHSRHSGVADAELERAAAEGRVRLLSHAPDTGYSVFETPDQRYLMHLGHPEYEGERLVFEWERDSALGRADVPPPHAFDPLAPSTPWREHREHLLQSWVRRLASPG
jgi:homoserine O-succinyltransferase